MSSWSTHGRPAEEVKTARIELKDQNGTPLSPAVDSFAPASFFRLLVHVDLPSKLSTPNRNRSGWNTFLANRSFTIAHAVSRSPSGR